MKCFPEREAEHLRGHQMEDHMCWDGVQQQSSPMPPDTSDFQSAASLAELDMLMRSFSLSPEDAVCPDNLPPQQQALIRAWWQHYAAQVASGAIGPDMD
eukprot:CAMPEP_0196726402 /NCGR_PEP_ID=MMETSP1091-20130531/7686_1 /TAXON_ID=302021 /ORGANISM="Rhodomonas sp., Strain CCMP768" /LENGTH=98 /DNA_ID=CAMNT_0042068837 /DNA_START=60 /DNA_END=356 /DNA_ORIENTATION=+